MSFTCNLYTTLSERTALDKTFETAHSELSGTLINDSNVINPSILVHVPADTLSRYNYMVISAFNRRYFITEITALTADTSIVSGHVDVLSTYKGAIRDLEAVIARQENKYNLYIDDNLFKVDTRTIIQTVQFDKGGHFTKTPGIALVLVG